MAARLRRDEPKKSNVPFSYHKTKAKYLKEIENHEEIQPWRANVLSDIKIEIRSAKKRARVNEYTNKYEVFRDSQGVDILILNRDKSPNIIECVSAEESFDLFVDIHQATGHGGKDKMLHNMRQRYHVSTACLNIFLELCNVCSSNKELLQHNLTFKNKNSHTAVVSILDLKSERNGGFGFILIFKFTHSGFTILRPITIVNYEQEVALELLNIFLDFGPPVKILADDVKLNNVLTKALSYISSMTCDCSVLLEQNEKVESILNLNLMSLIQQWMARSNSSHWSVACHLIQWKLNNSDLVEFKKRRCPQNVQFNQAPRREMASLDQKEDENQVLVVLEDNDSSDDSFDDQ